MQIVERVAEKSKTLNTAIAHTEREIALMREYRTRLTADVVTGKLDVRKAARYLPAEADKPDAIPDEDDLAEELDLEPAASEEDT